MSQSAEGRPDESHVARHALAAIIALTYKMQPNSMLNPTVPLQMADAILAAGFARPASPPPAAADWQNDEKVNGTRNLVDTASCDHCWHDMGMTSASQCHEICCYCGERRSYSIPLGSGHTTTPTSPPHGPHLPTYTVWYTARVKEGGTT